MDKQFPDAPVPDTTKLLELADEEAGLDRKGIYVTNAVKHFSFTERGKQRIHKTPQARHIRACRPWLISEVRSVKPEILVCLGGVAAKSVLGSGARVFRGRGVIVERDSLIGPGLFLVTVHPSSVLRTPGEQRARAHGDFVADLQVIADALG
ncbi:MAG: uracil-DNA glycosylase family protein [Sciscionella sp.]